MPGSSTHRILDAVTALFFLLVAIVLIVFGSEVQFHDGNYAAFYLGFGVLLECVYLATHFGLAVLLISNRRRAQTISQVLGLLLMLPLCLIVLVLTLLLEQAIRTNVRGDSATTLTNWIFGSLILVLLVAPSVLILRNIVCSFFDRRAEQALGADSP